MKTTAIIAALLFLAGTAVAQGIFDGKRFNGGGGGGGPPPSCSNSLDFSKSCNSANLFITLGG